MPDGLSEVFLGARTDAEVVRSVLEGHGIQADIRYSGASAAYPLTVGALSETAVLVLKSDLSAARELLAEQKESPETDTSRSIAFRRGVIRWSAVLALVVAVLALVLALAVSIESFR